MKTKIVRTGCALLAIIFAAALCTNAYALSVPVSYTEDPEPEAVEANVPAVMEELPEGALTPPTQAGRALTWLVAPHVIWALSNCAADAAYVASRMIPDMEHYGLVYVPIHEDCRSIPKRSEYRWSDLRVGDILVVPGMPFRHWAVIYEINSSDNPAQCSVKLVQSIGSHVSWKTVWSRAQLEDCGLYVLSRYHLSSTRQESCHSCPCAAFEDMPAPDTLAHESIDWAFTHEPQLTAGTDETHFTPDKELDRATAMTFLWAAAGKPEPRSREIPFSDVKPGKWYTKAILWAAENGITTGYPDGSFGILRPCKRGHLLTFLYAQQGTPGFSIGNPYSDVDGKWYRAAALWAYENGIEHGRSGSFDANAVCTRLDTVRYLYLALGHTRN